MTGILVALGIVLLCNLIGKALAVLTGRPESDDRWTCIALAGAVGILAGMVF